MPCGWRDRQCVAAPRVLRCCDCLSLRREHRIAAFHCPQCRVTRELAVGKVNDVRRAPRRGGGHQLSVQRVKRDINLLKKIDDPQPGNVCVLDVSMEKNIEALNSLLDKGAKVFYVDHHLPGDIPQSENLEAIIDTDPNVCTCSLVNDYLQNKQIHWAIAGAFGDNLDATANTLVASTSM